jgi:hypothetical protein
VPDLRTNGGYFIGHPGLYVNHPDHGWLLWLRLPNIVFGALTVLLSYLAVRLVTEDRWTPVVASALVAFMPHFLFMSAFVTNDNLANLLGAALVFAALRYACKPTIWRMAWVGAMLGLLTQTKLSTVPLYLVIAVALVSGPWLRRIGHALLGATIGIAVSGWYLIQNTVRYASPLAGGATIRYQQPIGGLGTLLNAPYRVTDPLGLIFVQVPEKVINSFWYQSDWASFRWPLWIGGLFFLGTFAGLVGLFGRRTEPRVLVALSGVVIGAFASVWFLAFQTGTYEGKYAIAGLSALAALVALGVERWRLWVRLALPAAGLLGVLVAVQQNVLAVHWI